jgi:glycerol uptake facilitator-like aquaporin
MVSKFSTGFRNKTKPATKSILGSGFLKVLVVSFLLFSLSFEVSNHNQRAALMPMMVGMMLRMVAVMDSDDAHKLSTDKLDKWVIRDRVL